MVRNCLICSKEFITYPNWIKRGGGKYCSRKCQILGQSINKVLRECIICKEQFRVSPSKIRYNTSRFCSHQCANKGATGKEKPFIQGENHPNWKDGSSRQQYPLEFNDELKESIRKRDDYECQLCGLQDEEHILIYSYSLMIHHLDYEKKNCDEGNLISLCNQCHGRTNYNRAYWTEFFTSKLKEKCNEKVI